MCLLTALRVTEPTCCSPQARREGAALAGAWGPSEQSLMKSSSLLICVHRPEPRLQAQRVCLQPAERASEGWDLHEALRLELWGQNSQGWVRRDTSLGSHQRGMGSPPQANPPALTPAPAVPSAGKKKKKSLELLRVSLPASLPGSGPCVTLGELLEGRQKQGRWQGSASAPGRATEQLPGNRGLGKAEPGAGSLELEEAIESILLMEKRVFIREKGKAACNRPQPTVA